MALLDHVRAMRILGDCSIPTAPPNCSVMFLPLPLSLLGKGVGKEANCSDVPWMSESFSKLKAMILWNIA